MGGAKEKVMLPSGEHASAPTFLCVPGINFYLTNRIKLIRENTENIVILSVN